MVPLVSQISEVANLVGAVNTLTVGPDASIGGDNTDIYGFLAPLLGLTGNLAGCCALLLGAGGAARSVAFGLAQAGCQNLAVYNRTVLNAERLLASLGPVTYGMKFSVLTSVDQLREVAAENFVSGELDFRRHVSSYSFLTCTGRFSLAPIHDCL